MPTRPERTQLRVAAPGGVELAGWQSGADDGPAVVLLHGLSMTADYVLMGSTRLEESGYRVVGYDARGHGGSGAPADRTAYGYGDQTADLVAVLDHLGLERALLVGSSMGAHTALRLALEAPERVAGLAVITPGFDPRKDLSAQELRDLERLADGIRRDGIDGFITSLRAIGDPVVDLTFSDLIRKRLEQHRDLDALADAIVATVRARPFESLDELRAIGAPAVVIGSRDRLDPRHPLEQAVAYAGALPDSELFVEPEGRTPLAWNRRKLGRHVLELAGRAHWDAGAAAAAPS